MIHHTKLLHMSGGRFNYNQYHIITMIEDISSIIKNNDIATPDDDKIWYFGDDTVYGFNFSQETIEELKKAVEILRQAYVYAHRIDWLVSGDDGEESFKRRLEDDLKSFNT